MKHRKLVALAIALVGCRAILGIDDPTLDRGGGGDSGFEAAIASGDAADDAEVAGPLIDAGDGSTTDADEPDVVVTFHETFSDPTLWNAFDIHAWNTGTSTFTGAVFDGRYIYLAPSNNSLAQELALRYDTQGGFVTTNDWEYFDTIQLGANARGFEGAFFDGRYVYFVPYANATDHDGLYVRFDTKAPRQFNDKAAWSTFDVRQLNDNARGFIGGTTDGTRYAYITSGIGKFSGQTGRNQAIAARLDFTQPIDAGSSWQFFDTQLVDPTFDAGGPRGFFGTVRAKNHVYLVPFGYGAGPVRGHAVRYDESQPFQDAGSWEMFDIKNTTGIGIGFYGGGFDGQHVYYVPQTDDVFGQSGAVARVDVDQPFADAGSWQTTDLQTLDAGPADAVKKGYLGAGFDGRYMYFVPYVAPLAHGWIARFDTQKPELNDPTAWQFFDVSTLYENAKGFCGSVFDGKNMYFLPCASPGPQVWALRFTATEDHAPFMPKAIPNGSFL